MFSGRPVIERMLCRRAKMTRRLFSQSSRQPRRREASLVIGPLWLRGSGSCSVVRTAPDLIQSPGETFPRRSWRPREIAAHDGAVFLYFHASPPRSEQGVDARNSCSSGRNEESTVSLRCPDETIFLRWPRRVCEGGGSRGPVPEGAPLVANDRRPRPEHRVRAGAGGVTAQRRSVRRQ